MRKKHKKGAYLSSLEICAGAGGQALGLEAAGFRPMALVEMDGHCRNTLRLNRPSWNVLEGDDSDLTLFSGKCYSGIDLLAGGVPCPPFSRAGKQLGEHDDRDLFPHAVRVIQESKPKAVLLENVRGFLDGAFEDYRTRLKKKIEKLGYVADWKLLNASDFGVSQLRLRVVIVAVRKDLSDQFEWPSAVQCKPLSVGELLYPLMAQNRWKGAKKWMKSADDIAPTIVGGSKKHGGPDLGPTRAKRAWASLGVDGMGIADEPPGREFVGNPRLTVPMVALIQGFPSDWQFTGRKTPAYRQVGNAFPPPVAQAVASNLRKCLMKRKMFPAAA